MAPLNPVLIDVPMPIRTPRLLIRPKQLGDGAITSAAVVETWEELHKWMRWAEDPSGFTAELMEIRNRQVMASFILRECIELIGTETATGTAVIWCGLHDIDWQGRQCNTGYWVPQERARTRDCNRGDKRHGALCVRCAWNAAHWPHALSR
jgi:hypothetical protein